jgi:Fanconi anemia group M protein
MYVTHPLIKPNTVSLRRYQEAVVARALDRSTLVVLPTGLGKTIIAAMMAAARLAQYPGSKVLFLAPTRPLSVQHHRTFSGILNIEDMIVLTGMDAVIKRKDLWENNRIIFATPQTIENDINRGLDLNDVSLIVVDECHRTVGNYSYVHIAEEYMKKAANPLILGLTASPSSDPETVKEICKNLFIEQVEAKTEDDPDVAPYIQPVATEWVKVELPEEFRKAQKLLSDVLRDDLRELKNKGYLESASVDKINRRTLLELQGKIREDITAGEDVFLYASLAASAIKVSHALELLETQGIWALDSYLIRLRKQQSKAIKRMFSDVRMNYLSDLVREMKAAGIDHPKLTELVRIVSAHKSEKVLIFAQYRDTVDRIIEKLNEADILVREFVGQATKDGKRGMNQKEQVEALENFKAGKYTALCATSVAEEGIDIPKVDVVIFYEPIPSEIRSIQRRGRTGRSAAGRVYVLIAKGTRDEAYYWASVHKERKMKTIVKNLGDRFVGDVGQQSLIKYSAPAQQSTDEKRPKIYVDTRERNAEILKVLKEKADIEIRQLAVGDFILSERVGVERKTKEDFLQSMIDKRLMTQANELSRNFAVPVMIIEGRGDLYSMRDIHANAIRGAIVSLSLSFGINIIHSHDENDTANMLYIIAKREQLPEDKEVALRGERKPLDLMGRQRFIIESLPDVSAVLARRLLERFGSVQNIMNATENELLAVEGIGKKKAAKIRETIKSMYKK